MSRFKKLKEQRLEKVNLNGNHHEEDDESYLDELEAILPPETKAKEYLRIGTDYYKKTQKPTIYGNNEVLIKWSKTAIQEDYPDFVDSKSKTPEYKAILQNIKKYDGFCNIPSHTDYKLIIGKHYNRYKELKFKPAKGDCTKTLQFLKNIFGEQLNIGIDYLKLLYLKPTQLLPVLCLVSKERQTGKSTFIKWLNKIYGENMTQNTNADFDNKFNKDWATKLIIATDETSIEKKLIGERIKYLSTSNTFKEESKGIDKETVDFYGKFIFASNNEENFLPIDNQEVRYWVRKLSRLKKDVPNYEYVLESEIPAFLQYLIDVEFSTPNKSRMWFTKEQLWTEALENAKRGSRPLLEKDIREFIRESMLIILPEKIRSYDDVEEYVLKYTEKDLKSLMELSKWSHNSLIKNIVEQSWGIKKNDNTRYDLWYVDLNFDNDIHKVQSKRGVYWVFEPIDFLSFDEIMNLKPEVEGHPDETFVKNHKKLIEHIKEKKDKG